MTIIVYTFNHLYKTVSFFAVAPDTSTLKSNRAVEEIALSADMSEPHISSSMQQYVAKKLSTLIENQTCFYDGTAAGQAPTIDDGGDTELGIRLFSGVQAFVSHYEDDTSAIITKPPQIKRIAKKKHVENGTSQEQLQRAAISVDYCLAGQESGSWNKKGRKNPRIEYYNLRKGQLYPVERENEFTKLRRKNNWDESKIRVKR